MMKVLLIGPGAVGVYFAGRLAQAGAEVTVVLRREMPEVTAAGYEVESIAGNFNFRPARLLTDAAQYLDTADWIICATKVLPEIDIPALLRPAVHSPKTAILLIQNGIGVEQQIAAAFPDNPVYGAIAYIGVRRDGANRILHQGGGRFLFGKYGGKAITSEARTLSERYAAVGVEARPVESLDFIRWQKLLWNAPFNTVSVLGGGLTTNEMTDRGRIEALCREIMLEVIAAAKAEGVELPLKMIDDNIEYTRNFPPYKSSMLVDFEAGRPLEIDAIVGNVIKIADRHGIAVPRLKTIEALLWARQMKN